MIRKRIFKNIKPLVFLLTVTYFGLCAQAQEVGFTVDRDSILIGEQVNYAIEVLVDTTDLVVFPEGQTFSPMEVVEALEADTIYDKAKFKLLKKYALTQFDSGSYQIPPQRILINDRPIFTDSARVEVYNVQVDTTKQGLFDIKNIIQAESNSRKWLEPLLWALGILALIGAFLYWLYHRSKKKAEAAKTLPPFEQALVALEELDHTFAVPTEGADQKITKAYYSKLTDIVKNYLDDEVYDHSLESTTGELIQRLYEQKQSGKINLSTQTIEKLESVLQTADLTKFARTIPRSGQFHADRIAIEEVVKETREAIPPPTPEELMRDAVYQENLKKRRKRKLILTSVLGVLAILIISGGILTAVKGVDFLKDNILGHPTKELLETDWIRSEYGVPPIVISTPKVLKRMEVNLPPEVQQQLTMSSFGYGSIIDQFTIFVNNTRYSTEQEVDLKQAANVTMNQIETQGVKNLVVKSEEYKTPHGTEGLKTYGTGEFPLSAKKDKFGKGEYVMLTFSAPGIMNQVFVSWRSDDKYAKEIADRIINSVELENTDSK